MINTLSSYYRFSVETNDSKHPKTVYVYAATEADAKNVVLTEVFAESEIVEINLLKVE